MTVQNQRYGEILLTLFSLVELNGDYFTTNCFSKEELKAVSTWAYYELIIVQYD